MKKWQEVRGINPRNSDALISAGCRYLNTTTVKSVNVLASIIGLEQIEVDENSINDGADQGAGRKGEEDIED